MFVQESELKDTALYWLPAMRRSGFIIYWMVTGLFLAGFFSMFFIHVDISARASGIIRPYSERTDIKSPVSGIIDTIYHREGEKVLKDCVLLTFRDPGLIEKLSLTESEISQFKEFVHDLELLTISVQASFKQLPLLHSALYRQEALSFFSRSAEQQAVLAKASYETRLNEILAKEKVISPKEFYDIRMQEVKAAYAFESFRLEQSAGWQGALVKYRTELRQSFSRKEELNQLLERDRIRAPVTGCLQELTGRYTGSSLQSGESICSISPDGLLMAECYVSSKDIGLVRTGQKVRLLIDALNYNYYGAVTGVIYSIDNDFVFVDKSPAFKIRCRLNEQKLKLPNGYAGALKKGMSFQARFIICNRSLWQLLYDGLNNWLNPVSLPVLKNPAIE
jgi:multidrug resistance efflux pump